MMLMKWPRLVLTIGAGLGLTLVLPFAGCGGSNNTTTTTDTNQPDKDATVPASVCGDGIVEPGEACDNGKANGPGTGCELNCDFSCTKGTVNGDSRCDDHEPCTGTKTCNDNHACVKGTPLPENASCGNAKICRGGICSDAVCGDGVLTPPEECDEGANNGPGKGCESNCKWTCIAGDTTRDCKPTDSCAGQGTCDATKHTCAAGTPVADGTACEGTKVCKAGVCSAPQCGDGIVEAGEQCDFGSGNGIGTGCEANCTFSCSKQPESCVTGDLCGGTNTCTTVTVNGATGQKCVLGTPPADNTPCANGGKCTNHLCVTDKCGNGTLDPGEQCDWGSGNGVGVGCEKDCLFSCTVSPNSCPGADACSAQPQVCKPIAGPTGNNGQKCSAGTVLAQCAGCGGSNICVGNVCKADTCGDHCVSGSEQCDPPDGVTCDSNCKKIVCGDGVRAGAEQCDDGNTTNLDGCDSTCKFEQEQRVTQLKMQFAGDSYCSTNALGTAISATGQGQLQQPLDDGVKGGTINVMFKFTNGDLTGTTGNVTLGSIAGAAQDPDAGAYNGNSDLDWWYSPDPTSIDGSRNAIASLTGTFTTKTLNAGPGSFSVLLVLSGVPAKLDLWNAKLRTAIGATSTPLASTGTPPGHLASEHLDPTLQSFGTSGVGSGNAAAGELCGNVTAESLSKVGMPTALISVCAEHYTASNHLLDAFVGGCKLGGFLPIINVTQPDQLDSTAPSAGAGGPYTLSASNTTTRNVDTCTDHGGGSVPLGICLKAMAYSSAFKFSTDRVIIK